MSFCKKNQSRCSVVVIMQEISYIKVPVYLCTFGTQYCIELFSFLHFIQFAILCKMQLKTEEEEVNIRLKVILSETLLERHLKNEYISLVYIYINDIFFIVLCYCCSLTMCLYQGYIFNGKTNERRSIYLYLVFFHFQHICTHILITTDNKLLNRERESLPKIDRKSIYSLFDNNNLVSSSLSLEIESYAEKRSCPFSLETKYSLFS